MNKRASLDKRCKSCNINFKFCICPYLSKQDNNNSIVSLIMHHRERALTSNTATLLDKCLKNSALHLRGIKDTPLTNNFELVEGYHPLYLFPHEGAVDLTEEYLNELGNPKIQLIIPDGTWSQAQKIYRRESVLKDVTCVKLSENYTSKYGLRRQSREGGVCTMEAGTYALGVIEGIELQNKLMNIFDNVVEILQAVRRGCSVDFLKEKEENDKN